MPIKKSVESVKEFLLRSLLASEKLDVVNQEKISLAITLPEFDEITVLDRIDELVDEQLTRDVEHLHVSSFRPCILSDGLHQMGFAQADAAVNEQRIVRARRGLCDGKTGCVRDFIVRADDEGFERVSRIESRNGRRRPCVHLRRQIVSFIVVESSANV